MTGPSVIDATRDFFAEAPASPRSPWAAGASLLVHGAMVAVVAGLALRATMEQANRPKQPLTFVSLALAPRAVFDDTPPVRTAPLVQPSLDTLTIAPPPPLPAPEPDTPVPTPPTPVDTPRVPEPVVMAPRQAVVLGSFAATPAAAVVTAAVRVEPTGFDQPESVAAATTPSRTLATGAFDAIDGGTAPGNRPAAAVAPGGFDQAASSGARSAARGQVVSTGFGSATSATETRPAAGPVAVRSAGFADQQPPPPAARETTQPAAAVTTQVEVTFKPTPAYTDEARANKVQGEVLLEVEFTASGQVRVLRVVRGLGYGLDEMASRAAAQMQFKPATSLGRPVDFRANVQIVFRLS